jgi:uncharacterized membrane protein
VRWRSFVTRRARTASLACSTSSNVPPDAAAGHGALARILTGIVVVAGVFALGGIGLMWPGDLRLDTPEQPALVSARVLAVEVVEPSGVRDDRSPLDATGLILLDVEVLEGDAAGTVLALDLPAEGYPEFRVGDIVELLPADLPGQGTTWFVTDLRRLGALGWLALVFVGGVLAVGRWRGLRSLIGLGLSLWVVIGFMLPAILAGSSPPLVALVGGTAIMLLTLYLSHGLNAMTTAAAVGTLGALVTTVVIALVAIDGTRITGFASEDAVFARSALGELDLRGLVLAGLIVAALGVLDDVTVSQASTVFTVHETDPTQSFGQLFARGMRVGRDHIASVVNTLFLAYAGASLGLLVLFSTSGLPVSELVNTELVAVELVKTMVGSLGLLAAVPLTTLIAAASVVGTQPMTGRSHRHPR